jgi:SAM-dependent methyltransferase
MRSGSGRWGEFDGHEGIKAMHRRMTVTRQRGSGPRQGAVRIPSPGSPNRAPEAQLAIVADAVGDPAARLAWRMQRFFGRTPLRGARVLDVGCGAGATTFFALLCGAREVVSLEPELDGSSPEMARTYHRIRDALGLTACELLPVDFVAYSADEPFDVITFRDSINHIREVTADAGRDEAARSQLSEVTGHATQLLAPDGHIVLSDCSRRNAFNDLGLVSPLAGRVIEWPKHQTPSTWRELLRAHGTWDTRVEWHCPSYRLRHLRAPLENRLAAYLTFSYFVLRARRLFDKASSPQQGLPAAERDRPLR